MIDPIEVRDEIIRPVVDVLGGGEAAVQLIFRTGLAESGYRVVEQIGGGPALGYWQCEPDTFNDYWLNFISYRKALEADIFRLTGVDFASAIPDMLKTNHKLAAALCRVHYRRAPEALPDPDDIEGQADLWLNRYNAGGKGSIKHFLEACEAWT